MSTFIGLSFSYAHLKEIINYYTGIYSHGYKYPKLAVRGVPKLDFCRYAVRDPSWHFFPYRLWVNNFNADIVDTDIHISTALRSSAEAK